MIKKLYSAAIIAACALTGCSKTGLEPDCGQTSVNDSQMGNGKPVELTVTVSDTDMNTKIVGSGDDKKVNSLQVIVFNKHGLFETSAVSTSSEVTFSCTAGRKHIVALVNAMTETDISTFEEFSARKAVLEGTDQNNCIMVGDDEYDIVKSGGLEIKVKRLASMVVLKSVRTSFGSSYLKNLPFEVKSVYLINAAGNKVYIGDADPDLMYNVGCYDPATSLDILHDEITGVTLTSGGASYDVDHYFYCYPNPASTKTRLIIEATIDSDTYYYPIELPDLQSNNKYSYDVTIKGLGKDSPDIILTPMDVTALVTVTTWTEKTSEIDL